MIESCPFCRSGNVHARGGASRLSEWAQVRCHACGATGPKITRGYGLARTARSVAIDAWNRALRTQPVLQRIEIKYLDDQGNVHTKMI